MIACGQRLWFQRATVTLLMPHSAFFRDLPTAVNYLMPIPAAFYFKALGFLSRFGKQIAYTLTVFILALFVITRLSGRMDLLRRANNVVVIAIFCLLIVRFLRDRNKDRDSSLVRRGLLVFAAFALGDNIVGMPRHYPSGNLSASSSFLCSREWWRRGGGVSGVYYDGREEMVTHSGR